MDVHSAEKRSRNMQAIRSRNTKMEIALGKGLWGKGLRYRKNDKSVFGRPDFTFKKIKVAVFVDSEFFHGKDWQSSKHRIQTNQDFWWNKIESNILRDSIVNKTLRKEGWTVLRFWSLQIKANIEDCINRIKVTVEKRKNGN